MGARPNTQLGGRIANSVTKFDPTRTTADRRRTPHTMWPTNRKFLYRIWPSDDQIRPFARTSKGNLIASAMWMPHSIRNLAPKSQIPARNLILQEPELAVAKIFEWKSDHFCHVSAEPLTQFGSPIVNLFTEFDRFDNPRTRFDHLQELRKAI